VGSNLGNLRVLALWNLIATREAPRCVVLPQPKVRKVVIEVIVVTLSS
jgi:hypothetical protein